VNDAEATLPPQRRAEDPRIAILVKDMETVKGVHADMQRKLDENTIITAGTANTVNEIRDILTTFKTLGKFAKWAGTIAAAVGGAWAAVKGVRGG
jgi:hypothetical protein